MEDVQLVHALQTRQDGAMEQFQTAYTPLLRYIIYQFSISKKTDISEGLILETFKIYFLVS